MGWWSNLIKKPEVIEVEITEQEPVVIDIMKDDVDPEEVTIENAYKTRWIWYHTILAIEIMFTNILLVAILLLIAFKL
jgi:hypothetical protein